MMENEENETEEGQIVTYLSIIDSLFLYLETSSSSSTFC